MRRATVTLTDELEDALDAFRDAQEVPPSLTAITQAALRECLAQRGYLRTRRIFWLTPAQHGSGDPDASRDHNRFVADAADSR